MSVPGSCCPPVFKRQNSIPVHYVTGTHYEVGYSVVSTTTIILIIYLIFFFFFYFFGVTISLGGGRFDNCSPFFALL